MKEFIDEERRLLEMKNIHELRAIGKRSGVKASTTYSKQDLIDEIIEVRFGAPQEMVFETRGRPSKKTETEVYYGNYPTFNFGKVVAAASVERYNADNQSGEMSGIVELHTEGFGMLHVNGFFVSKDDLFIPITIVKKHDLRDGDLINVSSKNMGASSVGTVVDVLSINSRMVDQSKNRLNFFELTPCYPTQKFKLSGNSGLSLIDTITPIGKGQRLLLLGEKSTGKNELLLGIANQIKEYNDNTFVIPVLLSKSYDEIAETQEIYRHFFAFTTFEQDCTTNIRMLSLALSRGLRMAEEGKDAVILINDLNTALKLYEDCITKQQNLTESAVYNLRNIFGLGTCTKEAGSLTIIASVDDNLNSGKLLIEELYQLDNSRIYFDTSYASWGVVPSINIAKSRTQKDNTLQSAGEFELSGAIRSKFLREQTVEGSVKLTKKLIDAKSSAALSAIISG